MRGQTVALAAALIAAQMPATAAAQAPLYRLVGTIPLGAGERWDYAAFDPSSGRVYVAHGDHVTVVDPNAGRTVGDIGTFPGGTHGIALAGEAKVGFTDDGKAGIAAVFDPATLKVTQRITVKPDADGIVFDPASGRVYVVDGDSGAISAIDPKTRAVVATISVGSGLEAASADGEGSLFVDGVERHDIVKIDTRDDKVVAHFAMPGCERPHGIAVDPKTRRVFATCVNKTMVVVDADTGANVASVPIGAFSDGVAFDPARKRVLSSNGEGMISVIEEKDANHFVSLGEIPTARSARTIAIDPATGRLFLPAAAIDPSQPAEQSGGRSRPRYLPGSLKLLVFAPAGKPPS
ncbi:MAG TPA: YncE family protein [Rhizomicrobium sp.]|nr:YncE family protein [Rhizomicrobium sp.]